MDLDEWIVLPAAAAFVARSLAVTLRSRDRLEHVTRSSDVPFVSIVVPARNEERQIETCVRSLLAQRYGRFEVIAVDDRSTDATPAILARLAETDTRLRVVDGLPLPAGWVGKPWALAQGMRRARGQWLLFTDADTEHHPDATASAMQFAANRNARFLSLLPTQRVETPAERLFLPTILWMIAFGIGSLDAINDPMRADAAIFNGQYLLCERNAFESVGGHARVRSSIAEDYDLARIVKRDGRFYSMLADANGLVHTRMYRSFGEIWDGFSKNLYLGVREHPLHGVLAALALASVSPIPSIALARAIRRRRKDKALRIAAALAGCAAAAEFAMQRSRFPRGSGLFFPLGAAAMLAIFLNSALQHGTGRIRWRGRRYSSLRQTPGPVWNRPGNR